MKTAKTRKDLWRQLAEWRRAGERIALVPTMGNLHQGHISLVEFAREHADRVVATVFVNPTQFGEGEDFEVYPRAPQADAEKLAAAGCDLMFMPLTEEIYPFGLDRAVRLRASPDLAGRLEGRFRPGHFDGVVTVVARLFAIVRADVSVFGEKDYQQLLVIRRMAEDLGFSTQVLGAPTVRASSGLALSSRNSYLQGDELEAAGRLNTVLRDAAAEVASGAQDLASVEAKAEAALQAVGLRPDYVRVRNAVDLARPGDDGEPLRILAAAWCGKTRLIDNMAVVAQAPNPAQDSAP